MTEQHVYDFSAGRPGAANLQAFSEGGGNTVGTVRYLHKLHPSSVNVLDSAEYNDNRAHGLGTGLVYEDTNPARAGQGHGAGDTDARWALQQAQAVGIASPRCIYLATDYDADPEAVRPYYEASSAVLGEASGAYASYRVLDALFSWGLIRWGWQPAAWSHGLVHPKAHLYQRIGGHLIGGITCDQNVVLALDWGQHPSTTTSTPNAGGQPSGDENEDDMATVLFGLARLSRKGPDGEVGDIFKINYLAGTYTKIPDPATLKEVQAMLARQFTKDQVIQFSTTDMDRFGTEVPWGALPKADAK